LNIRELHQVDGPFVGLSHTCDDYLVYFIFAAGVSLCISKPMVDVVDWGLLLQPQLLLLATPGLVAALLLTWLSRSSDNPAALPMAMVAIPAVFYLVIYIIPGWGGLQGARDGHWVGDVAPPVPVSDIIGLVNFALVRWDLVADILWTWVGMIFVVSFASCLDVAAVSMDMGEALDTNKELTTVGICNCK
jgi:MFS superfamily sulfate permease-like transporter